MHLKSLSLFILICAGILFCVSCKEGTNARSDKDGHSGKVAYFSFVANQCAGNVWYKPEGSIINAHLDESFGNRHLWPQLIKNLKRNGGSFSVYAAEIGHLSHTNGLLPLLKEEGIPLSVEMPGFTQCIRGKLLGEAELNGKPVNGANIFSTIFRITDPVDRTDPLGNGWFVSKDRTPVIPDEILFDERFPNLCPVFDPNILAGTNGTWEERRTAANTFRCAVSIDDYNAHLAALMQDYVDFLKVAKEKWGDKMPEIGIHWCANPCWEWRDQNCLDTIYAQNPSFFDNADNLYTIVPDCPQYNSVLYLNDLIDVLTSAGFKPKTVYMDVDWLYNVPYITEVLKRHKEALRTKGVQMGINIVEAALRNDEELFFNNGTLTRRTIPEKEPNELYENTLIAIVQYLQASGIYEKDMQMRVGSWSPRPYETGTQIDETIKGSMAHIANEIVKLLDL